MEILGVRTLTKAELVSVTTLPTGGVPVTIDLKEVNQFRLTPEEMEEKITPRTKAILIGFPNNPTGAIMEKEDLEKIAKVAIEHDILVSFLTSEHYNVLYQGEAFILLQKNIYFNELDTSTE